MNEFENTTDHYDKGYSEGRSKLKEDIKIISERIEQLEHKFKQQKDDMIEKIDIHIGDCESQIEFDKKDADELGCEHTVKVLKLLKKELKGVERLK